jgi:AraC family transcriptional regulator, transcriptional activator of pobA
MHLSEKEEEMITATLLDIERGYKSPIDNFSQDVIVSQIELLLNYSNRFYNRQFITRKHASNDLLINLEALLNDYFNNENVQELGLPTVH